MKILSFIISGPFAHFRKIYGTNTALSYMIPPRTTLAGLLAGCLGLPKDQYHELMSPERLRLGVSLLTPVRKSFHRVNHLAIKSTGDFRGRSGHTQTPLELISGLDIRQDSVTYRVFVAPGPEDEDLFERLVNTLDNGQQHYTLCLGAAFCPAFVQEVRNYVLTAADHLPAEGETVHLQSAVNRDWITRFELTTDTRLRVDEDVFPHFFAHNGSRALGGSMQVIHGSKEYPLPVRLKRPAYRLPDEAQAFVFLED
jgi:CRISPR-associated protein Cas5h